MVLLHSRHLRSWRLCVGRCAGCCMRERISAVVAACCRWEAGVRWHCVGGCVKVFARCSRRERLGDELAQEVSHVAYGALCRWVAVLFRGAEFHRLRCNVPWGGA